MILFSQNLQVFTALLILLFIGIILSIYYLVRFRLLKVKSPSELLSGFRAKMWMTIGIGSVFFPFYLFFVWLISYLVDHQLGMSLFFMAYHYPHYFIYAGLIVCICFSFLIYFVRILIKFLFMSRNSNK